MVGDVADALAAPASAVRARLTSCGAALLPVAGALE